MLLHIAKHPSNGSFKACFGKVFRKVTHMDDELAMIFEGMGVWD
jgi:hypothetical protein